jgi:hypothetical protein
VSAGAGAAERASERASERLSARAYRLLLRAYPADFRAAYGREMALAFRDQLRDQVRDRRRAGGADALGFWAATLWDVARSAPALRLDAARARWRARRHGPPAGGPHLRRDGGAMRARRAVAALAVLGGLFQLANTGAEAWAGYAGPAGGWRSAMALAFLMGALLLAAGAALLRRGPGAARLARGAALACLALVAGLQVVLPFMSIFARLLGVGLPVALLLVTRRPRGGPGRDPSVPAVA